MFELEKLARGIVYFVNFISVRIVSCLLFYLILTVSSGAFFVDQVSGYLKEFRQGVLSKLDQQAHSILGKDTYDDLLLALGIVLIVSSIDLLHRAMTSTARALPHVLLEDRNFAIWDARYSLVDTWRLYKARYDLSTFIEILNYRVGKALEREKSKQITFRSLTEQYAKSALVFILLLRLITPKSAYMLPPGDLLFWMVVLATLIVSCVLLEIRARQHQTLWATFKVLQNLRISAIENSKAPIDRSPDGWDQAKIDLELASYAKTAPRMANLQLLYSIPLYHVLEAFIRELPLWYADIVRLVRWLRSRLIRTKRKHGT